jgi:hypothetical protein
VCGGWYKFLGSHIHTHAGFKERGRYKKQFGFPLSFPLCSQEFSRKQSIAHSTRLNLKHLKNIAKKSPICHAGQKMPKALQQKFEVLKYGHNNPSHENIHDICRDQMLRRMAALVEHLKKFPSTYEVQKYDHALLSAIKRKYGNWNVFKKKEFPQEKIIACGNNKYSKDYLLFVLHDFKRTHGRQPLRKDFYKGNPSITTFVDRFGNWDRAVALAGLPPGN